MSTLLLVAVVSFVLGGLLWGWVLSQVKKFINKND